MIKEENMMMITEENNNKEKINREATEVKKELMKVIDLQIGDLDHS